MYLIIGDSRIVGPVCDKNGVAYVDMRERERDHSKNNHNNENCGEKDIESINDNKDYNSEIENNDNYDHNIRNSNIKNSKINDDIDDNIKVTDTAVSTSDPIIINFDFLSFSSPPSTPTRTVPIKPVLTTIGINQTHHAYRDISDISVDDKKFTQRTDNHENKYDSDTGNNGNNNNDNDNNDSNNNNISSFHDDFNCLTSFDEFTDLNHYTDFTHLPHWLPLRAQFLLSSPPNSISKREFSEVCPLSYYT